MTYNIIYYDHGFKNGIIIETCNKPPILKEIIDHYRPYGFYGNFKIERGQYEN